MNPSSSRTNPNPDRHHEEDETHSTPYSHSAAGHSDEEDYGDIFEEDTAAHVAFRGKSRKRAEKQLKAMWGHLKDLSHEPVELTKATSRTIQKCFKRPKLRRDITDVMANNEFFYDIVFSVSLATVRSEFVTSYLECPQGEDCNPALKLFVYFLLFAQFWFHAFQLTLYTNRFTTEEFSFNVALYAHMGSIIMMAVNGSECSQHTVKGGSSTTVCHSVFDTPVNSLHRFRVFGLGAVASQVLVAIQFIRVARIPAARYWALVYAFANGLNAVVWIIGMGAAVSQHARIAIGSVSFAIYLLAEIVSKKESLYLRTLLPRHYTSRMKKFASLMLAQVLSGTIQPTFSYSVEVWKFIAGVLCLGFLFKILYFDFDEGSPVTGFSGQERITEVLWTFANFFLGVCLTGVGACIGAVMVKRNDNGPSDTAENISTKRLRWMLCIAVTLASLSSVAIQLSVKGAGRNVRKWRKHRRLVIRASTGLVQLVVPAVIPYSWGAEGLVWPMCCVLGIQALLDMYGRQRVDRSEEVEIESMPTSASENNLSSNLLEAFIKNNEKDGVSINDTLSDEELSGRASRASFEGFDRSAQKHG